MRRLTAYPTEIEVRLLIAAMLAVMTSGCAAHIPTQLQPGYHNGQTYYDATAQSVEELYSWGGKINDAETLDLRLHFRSDNAAAADAFIAELDNPSGPNFHAYIKPNQFNKRFGHHALNEAIARNYLKDEGFDVGPTRGSVMRAKAHVSDIERVFDVVLQQVSAPGCPPMFASKKEPSIAASLGIDHVSGLSGFLVANKAKPSRVMKADIIRGSHALADSADDMGCPLAFIERSQGVLSDIKKYPAPKGTGASANTSVLVGGFDARINEDDDVVPMTVGIHSELSLENVQVIEVGNSAHDLLDCLGQLANPADEGHSRVRYAVLFVPCLQWDMDAGQEAIKLQLFRQLAAQGQTVFVAPSGAYAADAITFCGAGR